MAILPAYTTSKLHAARINLRQTPSSTPGVMFNYVKGVVFGQKWAWFAKIFAVAQARPTLRTPLHEILDPPLVHTDTWRYEFGEHSATPPFSVLGLAAEPYMLRDRRARCITEKQLRVYPCMQGNYTFSN